MADDDKGQSGDNGDTGDQGIKTVTIEQFEESQKENAEIKNMLEELKKTQSGSDSKVTELQNLLKETKEKAEEAGKTEKQKFADRMTKIETELADEKAAKQRAILKGLGMQLLADKGIKAPKYFDRLIGQDAEETEALIMEFIEEQLERDLAAADEFARNNGRKVQRAKATGDMKTQDEYTDEELEAMSTEEFLKVQKRSRKNE